MATRKRGHFTPEHKAEVVKLAQTSGETPGQLARELDLTETAVRAWIKQAEIDAGKGESSALTSEREELAMLRRENKTLKMEREIPRKRRPSSPRRRGEVRVHRGGEGLFPGGCRLQGSCGFPERRLRVGAARAVGALARGREASRTRHGDPRA